MNATIAFRKLTFVLTDFPLAFGACIANHLDALDGVDGKCLASIAREPAGPSPACKYLHVLFLADADLHDSGQSYYFLCRAEGIAVPWVD